MRHDVVSQLRRDVRILSLQMRAVRGLPLLAPHVDLGSATPATDSMGGRGVAYRMTGAQRD